MEVFQYHGQLVMLNISLTLVESQILSSLILKVNMIELQNGKETHLIMIQVCETLFLRFNVF